MTVHITPDVPPGVAYLISSVTVDKTGGLVVDGVKINFG